MAGEGTVSAALRLVVLAVAVGLATVWLGWWVMPVIGALWGLLAPRESKASLTVFSAAALAWFGLLVIASVRGPVWVLADKVGGILAIPGWLFAAVTVVFPAVLTGVAAVASGAIREMVD